MSGALTACRCGATDWAIIRQPDFLEARCQRCRRGYDIGWSTRGYVAPAEQEPAPDGARATR